MTIITFDNDTAESITKAGQVTIESLVEVVNMFDECSDIMSDAVEKYTSFLGLSWVGDLEIDDDNTMTIKKYGKDDNGYDIKRIVILADVQKRNGDSLDDLESMLLEIPVEFTNPEFDGNDYKHLNEFEKELLKHVDAYEKIDIVEGFICDTKDVLSELNDCKDTISKHFPDIFSVKTVGNIMEVLEFRISETESTLSDRFGELSILELGCGIE